MRFPVKPRSPHANAQQTITTAACASACAHTAGHEACYGRAHLLQVVLKLARDIDVPVLRQVADGLQQVRKASVALRALARVGVRVGAVVHCAATLSPPSTVTNGKVVILF